MLDIAHDDFARMCFEKCSKRDFKAKESIILNLLFNEKIEHILTILELYSKFARVIEIFKNTN